MRPLRYPNMAPNAGLSMGNSIVQGLNSAMKNYMQMKQMRSNMAYHHQMGQAQQMWRQGQADAARQKAAGGTLADMDLINAMQKGGHLPQGTANKLLGQKAEDFINLAPPEQKQALAASIHSQLNQDIVPMEMRTSMNLNPNQLKMAQGQQANQSKENVANTRAAAYNYAVDTRTGQKSQSDKMKFASDEMNRYGKIMSGPSFNMMDPATKQMVTDRFHQSSEEVNQLHSSNPIAPGGSAQPKTWGWDQRGQANIGDTVTHPSAGNLTVGGKDNNGKLMFVQPSQPPQPIQTAPTAPQVAPPVEAAPNPSPSGQ